MQPSDAKTLGGTFNKWKAVIDTQICGRIVSGDIGR
jgi:hypothetical protein